MRGTYCYAHFCDEFLTFSCFKQHPAEYFDMVYDLNLQLSIGSMIHTVLRGPQWDGGFYGYTTLANGEYLSNVIKGNFLYVQPFSRLTVCDGFGRFSANS